MNISVKNNTVLHKLHCWQTQRYRFNKKKTLNAQNAYLLVAWIFSLTSLTVNQGLTFVVEQVNAFRLHADAAKSQNV